VMKEMASIHILAGAVQNIKAVSFKICTTNWASTEDCSRMVRVFRIILNG
jgi:hypothetical protein